MSPRSSRTSLIKLFIIVFAVAGFIYLAIFESINSAKVAASASGPTPSHTSAPGEANCTACHSDFPVNSGTGSVLIAGLPPNYFPNQQINVTITTAQADAVIYGFQVTALDGEGGPAGTFTLQNPQPPTSPSTQILNGIVGNITRRYVEHTIDGITPTAFGSKSWNFIWTAPAQRIGKVSFYAAGNAANSDGSTSGDYIYTSNKGTFSGTGISNFDSDGSSDVAVFRPSTGVWYSLNSTDGNFQASQFGFGTDEITPGDFDGDGKTDRAVWRPSTGVWYVEKSTGGYIITQFGLEGDVPVQADYDGDLKTDIAVWRPSTGVWYIIRSSNGTYDIRQFGLASDKIAQGDYDADGKVDVAVWRPSTGVWYIWRSSDNGYIIYGFGLSEDKPVPGDYDGDGRADIAVWRPSTGVWYLQRSSAGFGATQFGLSSDLPAPADFDGDGKTDVAVYRAGAWYLIRSSDIRVAIGNFGLPGDVPVPAGYISR